MSVWALALEHDPKCPSECPSTEIHEELRVLMEVRGLMEEGKHFLGLQTCDHMDIYSCL